MSRIATLDRPLHVLEDDTSLNLELTQADGAQITEDENGSVVALSTEHEDGGGKDESDLEPEKDETELGLERLVFGDRTGFRDGLKDFSLDQREDTDNAGEAEGLAGLHDADLFFTDLGDDVPDSTAKYNALEDRTLHSKHAPAWEDSDDDRMFVSLASIPRLRKLRHTEAEDVVSGREYTKRLRRQYEILHPKPDWARQAMHRPARRRQRQSDEAGSEDEEMELDEDIPSAAPLAKLLRDAQSLVRQSGPGAGKKRKLRPEVIDIQRTKDIAGTQHSAVTSLSFHHDHPLLLSSGPSSTLYLHQIAASPPAPTSNPLLTSMHIRGSPLTTTAFHPKDGRIFLSARRRYFHVWNLNTGQVEKISRVYGHAHEQKTMEHFKLSPDGKHMALLGSSKKGGGVINILSADSLQWASQVRVESRGGIADFCWWRDGQGLCIAAKNGEITEWSVKDRSVVARWQDEGAVGTTTLALGGHHGFEKSTIGTDRWIAIGSSSGIVNVYDRRVWLASPPASTEQVTPPQPKPTRILDQLTTPTSHLCFSPDGQVLAMASKWERDAMRLVHLPSCTVFKNWPTSSTPLGRITAVVFCKGDLVGGDVHSLLAVANEQGKIRLWEIR